jgi:hypothetical protein
MTPFPGEGQLYATLETTMGSMTVKLFEHDHGQENVVFFKSEKAHRVMHQHIGVEHKQFGGGVFFLFQFGS